MAQEKFPLMLIIYAGNGKGKTTAAFGLALRSIGWGKRVGIFQFVKSKTWPEGARRAIESSFSFRKNITTRTLGAGFVGIIGDRKPFSVHKKAAKKALKIDEILGALTGGLITAADIKSIVRAHQSPSKGVVFRKALRGQEIDLVFTGRNAPAWLIKKADLVTEMKEVKHPFQRGIQAKQGIDF